MKLSIIIPIFNAEKYLETCLDTVAECPMKNMECILVNDGSWDGSQNICERFVRSDSRFVLLQKENAGVSEARNTGIQNAKGEFILFLDADDYLDITKWELLEKLMNQNSYDFVAFSYYTLYRNGISKETLLPIKTSTEVQLTKTYELMYADSCLNTCWGKLFRRDIIIQQSIVFDKSFPIGEDFLFVAEYIKFCRTPLLTKEMLIFYRQHGESAMHKYGFAERINFMSRLYFVNKQIVLSLKSPDLESKMYVYYFRVLTNLLSVFSNLSDYETFKKELEETYRFECVNTILNKTKISMVPAYKLHEFFLMKSKKYKWIYKYFCMKGKV